MKLAKIANNKEVRANPLWSKLLKIRNSLVQLAAAAEMRQSGLDETRYIEFLHTNFRHSKTISSLI